MKIIVFGSSGFVGSHLADALTEAGHEMTIFDINPSPYLQATQKFIQSDILDAAVVTGAMDGYEVVYNFAGLADIDDALARPADTVRLNVLGCVNLKAGRTNDS